MDSDEKKVWSTEDIRSHRNDWSLAADAALFEHIQSFSQNFVERTQGVLQSLDALGNNLNVTATNISNTSDKFLFLANTQFVENRVYDEDLTPSSSNTTAQPKPEPDEKELSSILEEAFSCGIDLVDANYSEFWLQGSDSEDEELSSPSRLVPKPKNRFSSRSLPHVIGSAEFFKDDKVGLGSPSGSSDSSSSSTLSEDEDEEISSELKPYISQASLSSRSESPVSMGDSKSASPVDDLFGRLRDSLNSSGKLQPNEAKTPNQVNHSEISNQYSKQLSDPKHNESVKEGVQPLSKDPFSHHIGPAPSLFSPPPFNNEESSEDSDNESLFAGRKHNRNCIFIEDEDDDFSEAQNRKQRIENNGKEEVSQGSHPQETAVFQSNVPKELIPPKKLPAGAVSIFGRNMNPFPSGPPLFSRTEDSDEAESERTQETSSEDGFSVSHTGSTDFGDPKHDTPPSKAAAPIRKSLFDDDEDDDSKDFDSFLSKPSIFPSQNSSDSSRKSVKSLFSDNTEDIFGAGKDVAKSSSHSSKVLFEENEGSLRGKKSSPKTPKPVIDKPEAPQKASEKPSRENPKDGLFQNMKSASSGLFDSDDDLFSSTVKQPVPATKSQAPSKPSSLFDNNDTVDFSKSATPFESTTQNPNKKPFLDLFDDNEDEVDDFLFGSGVNKESPTFISSRKNLEATATLSGTNEASLGDDLFSKIDRVPVEHQPSIKKLSQNIFDDEEESNIFDKFTVNISKGGSPKEDKLFSDSGKALIGDQVSKKKLSANIFDDEEESSIINKTTVSKVQIGDAKPPPKLSSAVSEDAAVKEANIFSKSSQISNRDSPLKKSTGPNIFDDEDESSLFNESTRTTVKYSAADQSSNVNDSIVNTAMESALPKNVSFESESDESQVMFNTSDKKLKEDAVLGISTPATPPKPSDTAVKEALPKNDSSDPKRKPLTSPKPGAVAVSEIDKLKKKLISSRSDDFAGDNSPSNAKPKTTTPGKLAATLGHNINIAALKPGYKPRNIQKSEPSAASSETLSNSESAPALASISSQLPVESVTIDRPVPKSTSLPISLANDNDLSSNKPSDDAVPVESPAFTHLLANNAMKGRAKIGAKRRPPSQKARKEAAQASTTNLSFAHQDETNGRSVLIEPFPPEKSLEKSCVTEENHAGRATNTPQDFESDDLFGKPPSSSKIGFESQVSNPISSLFGDSSQPQVGAKKPESRSPATYGKEKSDHPELVSSFFDMTPPPLESDDLFGEKTSEKPMKGASKSSALPNQLFTDPISSIFADPHSLESQTDDDLFSPHAIKKPLSNLEVSFPETTKSDETLPCISDVSDKSEVPVGSKSFIHDNTFHSVKSESDDLFTSSTAEKSNSKQENVPDSEISKNLSSLTSPEDNEFKEEILVSKIFDDRPPPFEPDKLFEEDSCSVLDDPTLDLPSMNPTESVPSIFSDTPPLFDNDFKSSVEKPSNKPTYSVIEEKVSSYLSKSSEAQETNGNQEALFDSKERKQDTSTANLITNLSSEFNDKALSGFLHSEKSTEHTSASPSHLYHDEGSLSNEKADKFLSDSIKLPEPSSTKTLADDTDDLFSSSSVDEKVPESIDHVKLSSSKESKKTEEKILSKNVKATTLDKDVSTNESKSGKMVGMKKSSPAAGNPLLDNLSDEDLFGSYSTKPVVSALNKVKLDSSKSSFPTKSKLESANDSKIESKKEDDLFLETENIEKLFPKVKIGPKKLPRVDPLSEGFEDSDEDDLFDDSSLSAVGEEKHKPEEASESDDVSFKPAESMDDGSILDESFKTAPSIQSGLDKSGDLILPGEIGNKAIKADDFTASPTVEKHEKGKSLEYSSSLEDNKMSSSIIDSSDKDDLFKVASQSKVGSSVAPKKAIAEVAKSRPSLFEDDEEDDNLFGVASKPMLKKPSTPGTNSVTKTNPTSRGNLANKASLTTGLKKGSPSLQAGKSQKLFDDEEDDDDLFSSAKVKPPKVKTVEPSKKKSSSLPKSSIPSIFDDDEDSDTELFAASLKKK